ncbi:hypothetical protein DAPPUDRAFT_102105 [Daphnia pulex]|uniref:Uncharacterized protein n=1 Tax=Daphnia pulex TaxID=6669 RepID=E9GFF8_DAPPU|nr:hypothetical protein DAPPUDRAFT_102105 [Daphnia pulex]|eukprot:EFX81818.1 hypothetical protein DAPPUDRAFT_102105 [Daphnia pulex]
MDASPTSTHFNYHTTSPVHQSNFYTEDKAVILVHVPCLQVIPVISAPGHQCLVSELMKGKTPSWLVTMMIDNWRAALECDRLSGLKALLNRFLWGNFKISAEVDQGAASVLVKTENKQDNPIMQAVFLS